MESPVRNTKIKKTVLISLFISQALVLSVVESWMPLPFAAPGVKLGLANIITLMVIVLFGFRDAAAVVVIKCILASMFGGSILGLIYSISGGILATLSMALLYSKGGKLFSLIGISITGAIMHNVGQLSAVSIVMKELYIFSYLPLLLASGVVAGSFVGLCARLLLNIVKKNGIIKIYRTY